MQEFYAIFEPFLRQRERWSLWTPVAIGCGIGVYFALPFEPSLPVALAVLGALAAGSVYLKRRESPARWVVFFLTLAALGFAAGSVKTWRVASPSLEKRLGVGRVEGTVIDIDRLESGAFRMVLDRPYIEKLPPEKTPGRVRISVRTKTPRPAMGDRVALLAGLLPLSSPVAPGAFDFQRHGYFQGIGATGYALSGVEVLTPGQRALSFENFRQRASDRIHEAVMDKESAAVTVAILIGERYEISDEAWDAIRKSGLAHLIAISGLHIGIVAGFVFFVLRAILALSERATLFWPIKKIAAGAALASAVIYLLVVDSPVPAERSVLMIAVVMLAVILDRDPFSLRLAAFAATVILLVSPEMMTGPSFQMSFAAVIALIAFYEEFAPMWGRWARDGGMLRRGGLWLLGSMITTVVASSATAAFSLYHFQQLSLWASVLANMAAVPLTVFIIMPFGFIGLLLVPLGWDWLFFKVSGLGNQAVLSIAAALADSPGSMLYMTAWPQSGFVLIVLGMIWAVVWRGRLRLFGAVPAVIGCLLVYQASLPDVLIADNGKIAATRNEQGALAFSSARREGFIRSEWQRRDGRLGEEDAAFWPEPGAGEANGVSCDGQGCLYRSRGRVIAFPSSPSALVEDCRNADVVVAMGFGVKTQECPNQNVIDHWDLKDKGAHAITLDAGRISIVSVRDGRGQRPWIPPVFAGRTALGPAYPGKSGRTGRPGRAGPDAYGSGIDSPDVNGRGIGGS